MGAFDWSPIAEENAIADPAIQARKGASARSFPESLQGLMAGVAALAADQGGGLTSTGEANAYEVETASGTRRLKAGLSLLIRFHQANTGLATLNVDGTGPKPLCDMDGIRLLAAQVKADRFAWVTYDAVGRTWRTDALSGIDNTSDAQKVDTGPIAAALAARALKHSPEFEGAPTAPNPDPSDNTSRLATMLTVLRRERWRGPTAFDFIPSSYHDAIEGGTSTTDVTEGLRRFAASLGEKGYAFNGVGCDARLPSGVYNISDTISFNQVATQLQSSAMGAANFLLRRNLGQGVPAIEFRQKIVGYSNVGSGVRGIRLDMLGFTGAGIKAWKPYDCWTIADTFVENVAPGDHAYVIVPDPVFGPTDIYSQGVFMLNTLAAHSDPTGYASLYHIESLNEGAFILTKAFGCFPGNFGGNKMAPCNGFELVDCNGLVFTNPSAAFCSEHAFLARSTGRSICRGLTIDTPTIEGGRGVIKTVGVVGNDDVNRVLDVSVRNPRRVFPSVAHPDGDFALSRTRYGRFETKDYTVRCSETYRNRIETNVGAYAISGVDNSDLISCLPDAFPHTKVEVGMVDAQAIPAGAFTYVNYNLELIDLGGEYDPAQKFWQVSQYGRYRIDIGLHIAPNAATPGQIGARIVLNGTPYRDLFLDSASSVLSIQRTASAELDLSPFDRIEIQVYADVGASILNGRTATFLRVTPLNNGYNL